jgi:hypothetical protein
MLDALDKIASIGTALIAVLAYGNYRVGLWRRRRKLEAYLASEQTWESRGPDTGKRSLVHLMAALQMTESEIFEAAFSSRKVKSYSRVIPETGLSGVILFGSVHSEGEVEGG